MDKRIYLCLAHMSGKEMGFIQEAFDTNWVVPLGPNVNAFEQDLERSVGQDKKVVALSAGTAAVHLALLACGVGQGDEVIVQSFTFCASSHPVTYLGATPWILRLIHGTWTRFFWSRLSGTVSTRPVGSPKRLFRWLCMGCPTRQTKSCQWQINMVFRS